MTVKIDEFLWIEYIDILNGHTKVDLVMLKTHTKL